ncbi:hypothetical protein YTPLAS18_23060 [Nitrospira sp.]|nr:hypothetical protein YTPLAS18_23060 [Nitrospira sp.]
MEAGSDEAQNSTDAQCKDEPRHAEMHDNERVGIDHAIDDNSWVDCVAKGSHRADKPDGLGAELQAGHKRENNGAGEPDQYQSSALALQATIVTPNVR